MSTRSCIARREGDGWRGVYHHSDGYPSGLGCYLFRLIRREFKGDAEAFLSWALSHDGGWSHLFPAAVVKKRKGGGGLFDQSRPQPQCYCHGYFAQRDGTRPGQGKGVIAGCECGRKPYVSEDSAARPSCDPLSLEWVYVLDPEARTMAVLEAYGTDIPETIGHTVTRRDGTREVFPQRAYRHRLKAVVRLDGPEPDWWEMEQEAFTPEHRKRRETWVGRYLPPVEA